MAMSVAHLGDEIEQHETTCDLSDRCGCTVITYRLEADGWKVATEGRSA